MDNREHIRITGRLVERMNEVELMLKHIPARFGNSSAGELPPGGEIYDVLMVVDQNGNKTWSKPRFSTVNSS